MAKGERLAATAARDAVRAARPPARHIVPEPDRRGCQECGAEFIIGPGPGKHKVFCSPLCRGHFNSRCAARGKVLVPYALAWRIGRNSKKIKDNEAFAEMIAILDSFAAEDRKAGRPNIGPYVERQMATGYLYRDRKKGWVKGNTDVPR
jgi:hypothetical protein